MTRFSKTFPFCKSIAFVIVLTASHSRWSVVCQVLLVSNSYFSGSSYSKAEQNAVAIVLVCFIVFTATGTLVQAVVQVVKQQKMALAAKKEYGEGTKTEANMKSVSVVQAQSHL
jgi:hypothetical protein